MKNSTLVFNIVLAIAVAVLFYLHFSSSSDHATTTAGTKAVTGGNSRIAYFEIDSIQEHFEYYKSIKEELDTKSQANNKVLGDLKATFAGKYQEFQRVAPNLSQAEQASKQQELMQMEQAFRGKEKMMSDEMQDEAFKKMQDVKKKIEDYLKEYNKDKTYTFIFSYSPDLMYYKDSTFDITNDLIKGLNGLYKKKK